MTASVEGLAATYERLNADFYDADPDEYLHVRWLSLMLLAGRPDEALALLADGVQVGHIHASVTDGESDPEGVRDFATMESVVLLHQAAETLLRLYLAHVGRPSCPWIEVVAANQFPAFKDRVAREVVQALDASDVDDVFLGGTGTSFKSLSEEQRATSVQNLSSFLRVLARKWLEDANAYNSLKHGLAALPSAVSMSFAQEGESLADARVLGAGPSLDFLEWVKVKARSRALRRTTMWIDVSENLALVDVSRQMIASLWVIARCRYADGPVPTGVFVPHDLTPSSLRSPNRQAARRWSMDVGVVEVK